MGIYPRCFFFPYSIFSGREAFFLGTSHTDDSSFVCSPRRANTILMRRSGPAYRGQLICVPGTLRTGTVFFTQVRSQANSFCVPGTLPVPVQYFTHRFGFATRRMNICLLYGTEKLHTSIIIKKKPFSHATFRPFLRPCCLLLHRARVTTHVARASEQTNRTGAR